MQMATEGRQIRLAVDMSLGDTVDQAIIKNTEMPVQWKIKHSLLPFEDSDYLRHEFD